MAITYEEARSLREELEELYGQRHESLRRLRLYYHGSFKEASGGADADGIQSIFRDLTGNSNTVGPDLDLVRNFVQEIALKFQTFLSPLPMIRVPTDSPNTQKVKQAAVLKERALYGLWGEGNMSFALNKIAWYLPLMADAFVGAFPDFKRNIVVPLVRSPEYAYPIQSADMNGLDGLDAVIFCWKVKRSIARRTFPNWREDTTESQSGRPLYHVGKKTGKTSDEVEVLEFSDRKEFARFVGGQKVAGVEHNFGFNLFDQAQFIHIPDEPFGHGAVEQIVNINELTNATLSLVFQAMIENVFPRLVLVNPSKAPAEIEAGPGAVIGVNEGGSVQWLTPPVQAIPAQVGFLAEMERGMKEQGSMPDVNFGNFRASIVTGKAINELQGAGTGSVVEMVQGNGIGNALVNWNTKALFMLKRIFGDDTIRLSGTGYTSMADLVPTRFPMLRFKGKELVGSFRNEVIFAPAMDAHTKLVMMLQALGGGLVSKKHAREQIGIPDSEAMEEEIFGEILSDAFLQGIVQQVLQGADEGAIEDTERRGIGFLTGRDMGGGGELPALPAGVNPAEFLAGQPGIPPAPDQGAAALPPDMAALLGGAGVELPAPTGGPQEDMLVLEQVIPQFQGLADIEGRVFLVGQIVEGLAPSLEVALTVPGDAEAIRAQLPFLADRISFIAISGEPDEPWVEVTPGQDVVYGGEEPELVEPELAL